jgi:hypothetical protein
MRWILAAAAWLLLAGPVLASWNYTNTVTESAASGANAVEYFHVTATGSTTTRANGNVVNGLSAHNTATNALTFHVFTNLAPNFASPFDGDVATGGTFANDKIIFTVESGQTLRIEDCKIYGYHLATLPTTPGVLTIVAWSTSRDDEP